MGKCKNKAVSMVTWVNGDNVHMCQEHLDQVKGLCEHMGWSLGVALYPEGEKGCESKVEGE